MPCVLPPRDVCMSAGAQSRFWCFPGDLLDLPDLLDLLDLLDLPDPLDLPDLPDPTCPTCSAFLTCSGGKYLPH